MDAIVIFAVARHQELLAEARQARLAAEAHASRRHVPSARPRFWLWAWSRVITQIRPFSLRGLVERSAPLRPG